MIPKNGRKLPLATTHMPVGSTVNPGSPTHADMRWERMLNRKALLLRRKPAVARGLPLLAFCLALFAAAASSALAQSARVAGQVTTFGSSLTSAVGDAVDGSENVYVVTSSGAVYKETFTSSTNSYSENLLFTTASGSGSGIAVDTAGANVYVATGTGHSVAKYTGSGTSYTLASTFSGFTSSTAAAVDASGNVYIADSTAGTLYKETLSGSAYSQASIATGLTTPAYIAVDNSGNIFLNSGTTRIYEVSGSGTSYTKTRLGLTGIAGIAGIGLDGSDDLFLQTATDVVEAVPASGSYSTATAYYQFTGQAVTLDSQGNVYLASSTQSSGTKLTVGSGYLNFGSVGPGLPASMTIAFTLTSTSASTLGTPTVVTQGLTGYDFTLGTGSTCTGAAVVGSTSCTVVVQFQPRASGSRLGAVNLTTSAGKTIASSFLGGVGLAPLAAYQSVTLLNTISTSLSNGRGLTVDPAGNVYVANSTASQILEFPYNSSSSTYSSAVVLVSDTGACSPVGTALDGEGNLFYTCNSSTNMYELVGGTGSPVTIPVGYDTDDHLSVDAAGNLYPTSYNGSNSASNLFLKVAAGTYAVSVIATAPATARFVGAVTDAAGNTFAPDYNNDILYELPAGSNTLITLYSGSPLQYPHAIAEDAAGNLYITSTTGAVGAGTSNLLRFNTGNYTAAPAAISVPGADSLAITPDGNFYTIYNNTTLAVYTRALISLSFPDTAVGQTSPSQTVTLENDGTAPLTISAPSSGSNPAVSPNFSFDPSSTCPQLYSTSAPTILAIGASCTDVVEFSPLQAGTITGALVTTDNSANVVGSKQAIDLSANATQGTPTVSVSNVSGTLGRNATLSATVTGGGVAPTGSVTFVVGSGSPVTATCSAGTNSETCTASYPTATALSAGANTITATFAADGNYAAASATGTLTLAAAPTSSAIASSLNPSTFGATVTLTGTVSSTYGTPTGSVTFYDGITSLGTGNLSGTGTASLTVSTLGVGTHAITIAYGGTATFAISTSSAVNQVVKQATGYSNSLISSSPAPSFGSSVTFTDTLAVLGGVAPTGTVTFYNGATAIGTGTLNASGVATLTSTTLPVGTDKITASFGGDGNYASSTSAVVTETVSKASVSSSLATSNASPSFGSSITLTDTLPVLGGVAPSGTVTFYNGATSIGTGTLNASGVATLNTAVLPVGTDSVTATFVGDGNYSLTTSNVVTETVAKASGYGDVLTTSNATPALGGSVTFSATLAAVGGVYPTGTVTFYNGSTAIGTGAISITGVATLTTTALPVGSDSITASYPGDNNFSSSTSNAIVETVAKADVSSDLLSTSNASPNFGNNVTLTDTFAAVNGTYPSGTVTFYNGANAIGTGTLSATGVATLSTSALPVGSDPVTASFAGDANFNSATSNKVTETVAKATLPTDVLTSSNAGPAYGSSITLTDTLPAVNGTYPTGTITFYNGATAIGTGTINAAGIATLSTSALPVGSDSITAGFAGDSNFNSITSNALTETISKATGYSNVLTSSNISPTFGSSVTLTDTLAAVNGVYPTGSVTFYSGATAIGTGTISTAGVAALTTSALPVGSDSITAVYGGDATFSNSTSNALTEAVAKASVASDVLTTSNASPAFGGSVTLTDTFGALGGSYPTGTVTFYNGSTALGTGTISATGVATLTTSTLPVGTDSVSAVYGGDNTFGSATSNTLTETVAKATGYSDALTTSNATPGFGSTITLTDTIAAVNGVFPTGTVTFYNGSTAIGTGSLSAAGVATLSTATLPAGTDSITASYAGDSTFASATSNAVTETVAKATGYNDVLTTSNASPAFGGSIILTDTLAAVNGVYPNGSVTFYNGVTAIGTGTISATGVATLSTSALPVGTDSITAAYGGDTNFASATSNKITETIAKASGYSDVLTSSNPSPTYASSVTFTDTIAALNGVYPTGSVTFYNGANSIGTGTISAAGVATLSTGALPVGSDSINAVYGGDTTFSNATSNIVTETVAKASVPTDVLTSSNASPTFGGSVTLTDTLTALGGTYPTGTVTFYAGATALGTGSISASGIATLATSALPTGTDSLTAVYGGDATFSTATSNAITETVAKATGSNTLSTSSLTPAFGSIVTLTDTLSIVGGVAPSGTVTFYSGATVLGTVTLNSSGVVALSTGALPVGTDSITAAYGGDSNYSNSTSNTIIESVSKANVNSDVLTSSTVSPSFGQSVTFTDTLTTANGIAPTGTVTFFNGTTALGTVSLSGSGIAVVSSASLPTGADDIHAVYAGDTNYNGITSNIVTVTVSKIAATTNDTVTGSGTYGAATTSVTATIPYSGPSAPVGNITIADTHGNTITILASSCTAVAGTLTCTGNLPTANEPAGSNSVSVSQGSDANYTGSTGSGNVSITKAASTNNDTASGTGTYGAATTSVAVTVPFSGPSAPTGKVTVSDSEGNTVTVQASTCTAGPKSLSCTANLPTANEPVGANAVNVSQAPDANYSGSTGSGTVTINKAPATSTDTAIGTGTYGVSSTPVAITVSFAGTAAPSGAITVTDTHGNAVTVLASSCTSNAGTLTCTANLPTASEPVGANPVTVAQLGDANYIGSSGTGTVTINKTAPTGTDTASGTGTYGLATSAVKVSIPYTGATPPAGAITVNDTHGNTITFAASSCTATASVLNCTTNLPTANDPAGTIPVVVNEAADANYGGSTGSGTVTISKAPATTNDTAAGAGTYGALTTPVTVTIPYTGAAAPGSAITVTDTHSNTVSVAAFSCTAAGSTLTCIVNLPTANEPVGSNALTVSQTADSNYSGSTGSGTATIGKAPATTNDTATGTGTYGAATSTVVVTIPYAGTTAPSGAITVSDNLGNTVTMQASSCVTSGGALTCTASLPTANEPTGSNPVTVSQAGDTNYSGSTGSGTITINQAGARGDDSATGTGSYGAPSTPLTVVIPFSGSTTPTGAITVSDTLANTVTVSPSTCQASASALVCSANLPTGNEPVGSNPVSVAQAADANHSASTGAGVVTINKVASTTADTATGAGTYGAATTPVTVTIPFVGTAAPTGAVSLTDTLGNTVSLAASFCSAASQNLTCVVSLPTANEPLGSNQVTIAQASDSNYDSSTGTGTVTISPATVSPIGSTSGGVQNVTITQGTVSTLLTATLAYSGPTPPTGAVTFTVAGNASVPATCSVGPSVETCTAMYTTGSLAAGTYVITANEAADANYIAGSATGTLTVDQGTVSPILETISNVSNVLITAGTQSATLTTSITFNGPVPTGALTFNLPGGTPVTATCTPGPSPLTCTATYPTGSLTVGTYVITATEGADSNYPQGSATALLSVEANASTPASPVLTTGSNVSNVLIPYGTASANLSATIMYSGPVPTGTVSFTIVGGSVSAVAATCTTGSSALTCTALYPTASLGIGSYLIQVNEAADANYPAGSAIGTLTVTNVAASTSDSIAGTGTYGSPTTLVTVTIPYSGSVAPTGAITVTDTLGNTVTMQASSCTTGVGTLACTANLSTANVPVGADNVTVSEASDAFYAASSGSGSITINKAAATSSDTATGTGTYGAATTAVAVTIPYAGTTAPTGAITISDSLGNTVTVAASTCTAAGGTLTCNANLPTANEPLGSNTIVISQTPDVDYSGSTGSGTVTINKGGPTGGDSVSGTSTYGAATTAVTITIPYVGSTAPTGAITVADVHGNTVTVQALACSAAANVLTCNANLPTGSDPAGSNTVTVTQAPDAVLSGSTGTGTITINKAPATTNDTATGSGSYGAATTSVTVTIPFAGATPPTGAIAVTDAQGNTVTIQAANCTASKSALTCTASLPTANEPVGTNTITVTQAADANYSGSNGSGSIAMAKSIPTLTAPSVSPLNASFGTAVTLTETIPAGETGTVTFYSGTTALGTATIANGVATLTTTALPQGTDSITATANGDSNYSAATSPAITDTVSLGSMRIAVTSSQSPSNYGSSVTFTATVSTTASSTVAGTVTFYDGTTALGAATVSNGMASLSTASLSIGAHAITAKFAPASGSTLSSVTSSVMTQTVQQITSGMGLTSSLNPAVAGQTVTFSATVPATVTGATPTGAVVFYDGKTVLGTMQMGGSGVANFVTSALTGGMHNITAAYAGDSNYAAATSGTVAQQISDFTVGNTSPAVSADPGAKAAFNITINPATGVAFTAPVLLTVTGLPANFTATFAPGTIVPGTGGTTSTMTVQTLAQVLTAMEHKQHAHTLEMAALWAFLFPLLGFRRVRRRIPKVLLMMVLCVASLGVVAPLTGCGGGYFGAAPANYTLKVIGTSGTLQRSTTVTLNVR